MIKTNTSLLWFDFYSILFYTYNSIYWPNPNTYLREKSGLQWNKCWAGSQKTWMWILALLFTSFVTQGNLFPSYGLFICLKLIGHNDSHLKAHWGSGRENEIRLCENSWHIVDMLTIFSPTFFAIILVYLNFGILLISFSWMSQSVSQAICLFFPLHICINIYVCLYLYVYVFVSWLFLRSLSYH